VLLPRRPLPRLGVIRQPRAERGFTTSVSPRLVELYSRRFGAEARARLEGGKRERR
jgi:hypothetical protein